MRKGTRPESALCLSKEAMEFRGCLKTDVNAGAVNLRAIFVV